MLQFVTGFTPYSEFRPDNISAMSLNPHTMARFDSAQILRAAASVGVLGGGANSGPRLLAALCNPKVTSGEVTSLIEHEPAMYARVLRVANSAYYGRAREIATIERALMLLGVDAIRGIAAATCLDRTLPRHSAGAAVDMKALLDHSLATAAAAQSLARIGDRALASDAFIAGLLHNLGVAVQVHLDTPGINAMIDVRRTDATRDMRELESERAAVGHEECMAVVFEAWHLPEALVAAARFHHDPMSAPASHRKLVALVNLGANLGLACGNTFTLEPAPVARNQQAMAQLGLGEHELDSVAGELPQRLLDLRSALLDG